MTEWGAIAYGELTPYLQDGNLEYCINRVVDILKEMPHSPYHHVLEIDFKNDIVMIAAHFDEFVAEQQEKIQLKAIYTETNGFYINFDRWYFEIFGYSSYGGHENYEWLAKSQAVYRTPIQLVGMETLQAVYKQVADSGIYNSLNYGGDPKAKVLKTTKDFTDLLVVLRFQDLIRRSIPLMQKVDVPVLATAHDYDFIYEVKPPAAG